MGVRIEDKTETGLLYARGVELYLIEWLREESSEKGYSVGEYLNKLLTLERDLSKEEQSGEKTRNKVR